MRSLSQFTGLERRVKADLRVGYDAAFAVVCLQYCGCVSASLQLCGCVCFAVEERRRDHGKREAGTTWICDARQPGMEYDGA